jgi:hypothetical protein
VALLDNMGSLKTAGFKTMNATGGTKASEKGFEKDSGRFGSAPIKEKDLF